jgi:hypothetical protein
VDETQFPLPRITLPHKYCHGNGRFAEGLWTRNVVFVALSIIEFEHLNTIFMCIVHTVAIIVYSDHGKYHLKVKEEYTDITGTLCMCWRG